MANSRRRSHAYGSPMASVGGTSARAIGALIVSAALRAAAARCARRFASLASPRAAESPHARAPRVARSSVRARDRRVLRARDAHRYHDGDQADGRRHDAT